ncbi:BlaI/MecI/CopY family transcriptional regulator [bacterium]|nr:BlaI/MecI/CopY family transcriptional regulator [bacterium]
MRFIKTTIGKLELQVLEMFWQYNSADIKTVHKHIIQSHKVTHNTVQSTVERLFKKGLLDREKVSHAYIYSIAISRQEFLEQYLEDFIDSMSAEPNVFVSAFVDFSRKQGKSSLQLLMKKVANALGQIDKDNEC